jgi:HSP20 family protein
MANEQSQRQSQRQGESQSTESRSTAIEQSDTGDRGLATRLYQDPFSVFDSLFERMQRDFFGTSLLNALVPTRGGKDEGGQYVRVPRAQMRDSGEALELTAEMPGIEGANVSVQIEDDVVTISGEQRAEEESDDTRTERYVSFHRRIPLPDGVNTDQAEASYRNGVLTIRFPKTRARSDARQIPVSTEQQQQKQPTQSQKQERAA